MALGLVGYEVLSSFEAARVTRDKSPANHIVFLDSAAEGASTGRTAPIA